MIDPLYTLGIKQANKRTFDLIGKCTNTVISSYKKYAKGNKQGHERERLEGLFGVYFYYTPNLCRGAIRVEAALSLSSRGQWKRAE